MNRITMHDICTNDLDDLMGGAKADCFYCDPPWGNLMFWRTLNGQRLGDVNWARFVRRLKFICDRHVRGPIFIEIGLNFESDIITAFGKSDGRYMTQYKSGKAMLPSLLLGYGVQPAKDPTGMSGLSVPLTVLSSLPIQPKSVLDCCVGKGLTVRAAKKIGMQCYVNELNPKRAAQTMKIMKFELVGKD